MCGLLVNLNQMNRSCHEGVLVYKQVGLDGPWSHLDDLPGLNGERGEVSAAVDWDTLSQDGVQTPHLIPRQHADPPTLLRSITGGHDDRSVHIMCVCLFFLCIGLMWTAAALVILQTGRWWQMTVDEAENADKHRRVSLLSSSGTALTNLRKMQ